MKALIERNEWKEKERVTEQDTEPEVVGVSFLPHCAHVKTLSLQNRRSF